MELFSDMLFVMVYSFTKSFGIIDVVVEAFHVAVEAFHVAVDWEMLVSSFLCVCLSVFVPALDSVLWSASRLRYPYVPSSIYAFFPLFWRLPSESREPSVPDLFGGLSRSSVFQTCVGDLLDGDRACREEGREGDLNGDPSLGSVIPSLWLFR